MRFKFSINDLIWLALVVVLLGIWWIQSAKSRSTLEALRNETQQHLQQRAELELNARMLQVKVKALEQNIKALKQSNRTKRTAQ